MKSKHRTVIVDDEPLARRGLRARLQEHSDIDIIAECKNGREAITTILEQRPDILFLDIQMPGMNGFDVLHALPNDALPVTIFVTAYDEFAVNAFDVNAIDYILKPLDEERLKEALIRAREKLEQQAITRDKKTLLNVIGSLTGDQPKNVEDAIAIKEDKKKSAFPSHISIRDSGQTTLVASSDIKWIDAAGDYMCLHAGEDVHIMRSTMKKLESELDPTLFQRIHRSTLVNLKHIEQVIAPADQDAYVILDNGKELKMSRSYKSELKKRLNI